MTALTYILGAASLRLLRRKAGRGIYWGLTAAISVGLYVAQFKGLSIAYFSLVLLMGVFDELEELGLSFNLSAFFTLVINSLVGTGAFLFWISMVGTKWSQIVLNLIEEVLKPIENYNPGLQIKYFDLMLQLPSVVLILWMAAIYLAVLLESRLLKENGKFFSVEQLKGFRVPDVVVWAFIAALLGKFGGFAPSTVEAISANALNMSFMLFFFQGIAVVTRSFEKLRMNLIWQTLFTVLIVVYLFLFVSVLGLMDHWFDFRSRLSKRTEEEFEREI